MVGYTGATISGAVLPIEEPRKPLDPSKAWPFDHTYVESSCGLRWGCFGRDHGGAEICHGVGDSSIADCLSQPNGEAGIIYGVTGVCHQAANRILHPAGVRVSRARGYPISVVRFGKFGKNLTDPSLSPCYLASPHAPLSSFRNDLSSAITQSYFMEQPAGLTEGYAAVLGETQAMSRVRHPDRIEELRELIYSVPDVHIDDAQFEELVTIREHLWHDEEVLGAKLKENALSAEKFLALTNAAFEISMMKFRDVLGSDFVRIFGAAGYHPDGLVDPEKFFSEQQRQSQRHASEPMSF